MEICCSSFTCRNFNPTTMDDTHNHTDLFLKINSPQKKKEKKNRKRRIINPNEAPLIIFTYNKQIQWQSTTGIPYFWLYQIFVSERWAKIHWIQIIRVLDSFPGSNALARMETDRQRAKEREKEFIQHEKRFPQIIWILYAFVFRFNKWKIHEKSRVPNPQF